MMRNLTSESLMVMLQDFDHDDDGDGEEFYARRFHGNAARLDHVDNGDYYDSDDVEFDVRKFHVDAVELDDVDDYDE